MDANASIQVASAVASAYAQSAQAKAPSKASSKATEPQAPKIQVQEDRFERSGTKLSSEASGAMTSAKTNATNTANSTDRVELSSSSQNLAPLVSSAKPDPKQADKEPVLDEQSQWSQDRLAKLDHLALLVKEGHYHIEPFMVDEIALRLARAMASI